MFTWSGFCKEITAFYKSLIHWYQWYQFAKQWSLRLKVSVKGARPLDFAFKMDGHYQNLRKKKELLFGSGGENLPLPPCTMSMQAILWCCRKLGRPIVFCMHFGAHEWLPCDSSVLTKYFIFYPLNALSRKNTNFPQKSRLDVEIHDFLSDFLLGPR